LVLTIREDSGENSDRCCRDSVLSSEILKNEVAVDRLIEILDVESIDTSTTRLLKKENEVCDEIMAIRLSDMFLVANGRVHDCLKQTIDDCRRLVDRLAAPK